MSSIFGLEAMTLKPGAFGSGKSLINCQSKRNEAWDLLLDAENRAATMGTVVGEYSGALQLESSRGVGVGESWTRSV